MIKAICRWKMDASAVLYARLLQDEHTEAVDLAMDARITPTLIATTRRDCVLDNDHCVQRAGGAGDARGSTTARAASPSGPPTRTAADSRDDASASSDSDDDSDGEADGVVVAGPPVDIDAVGPGDAVAVRFNSRHGGAEAYGGVVVKVMARSIRVKFCGCGGSETYDVKPERVLSVASWCSPPRLLVASIRGCARAPLGSPIRPRALARPRSPPLSHAMEDAPCGLQRGFRSTAGGKRPPSLAAMASAWCAITRLGGKA